MNQKTPSAQRGITRLYLCSAVVLVSKYTWTEFGIRLRIGVQGQGLIRVRLKAKVKVPVRVWVVVRVSEKGTNHSWGARWG